jgi:hypothetical protein
VLLIFQINFHLLSLSSLMRPLLLIFIIVANYSCCMAQGEVRLNERKVIASHNSYKKRPDPKVLRLLSRLKKQLGPENDPSQLDYGHVSLPVQFDSFAVRGIEIDIYNDPKGGHFTRRRINLFLSGLRQRVHREVMNKPGFKVLHIADVDFETNYLTFRQVLEELKLWSSQHPDHDPVFVNVEPKADGPGTFSKALRFVGFKASIPYDSLAFCALDEEIRSVLPENMRFTPADLRASFSTVKERLLTTGWPFVSELAGKFIFILDGKGDQYERFSSTHLLFTYGSPSSDETAFVIRNEPRGHEVEIAELAKMYIVRTRSDAGTHESRTNDYSRFNAAKRSGAQIISTDYYHPDVRWSKYKVGLQ